jgi:hypothetical protein
MRTVYAILSCGAGVLFCLVMTGTAQGQTRRPGVYRMEINNGGAQTVRYFSRGISPGESGALRDLERSENELAFVRNLQDLKRQYVSDERQVEATRALAQKELYGRYMAAGGYGLSGSFAGLDSTLLAAYNLGGAYGLGAYYGLGGVYTPGLYTGLGYGRGYSGLLGGGVVGSGLAYGIGTDDPIKDSLATVIAQQATPQYVAAVDRNMDRAVAQAASSPSIRVALGMPDAGSRPGAYIRPVAAETEAAEPVIVTLKDGTVYQGSKLKETKDWVIVTTAKGRQIRIRPSEVTRIDEAKPAVGGAVGD